MPRNLGITLIEYLFWKMCMKFPVNVLSILLLKGFSLKKKPKTKKNFPRFSKTKTQIVLAIFFPQAFLNHQ